MQLHENNPEMLIEYQSDLENKARFFVEIYVLP